MSGIESRGKISQILRVIFVAATLVIFSLVLAACDSDTYERFRESFYGSTDYINKLSSRFVIDEKPFSPRVYANNYAQFEVSIQNKGPEQPHFELFAVNYESVLVKPICSLSYGPQNTVSEKSDIATLPDETSDFFYFSLPVQMKTNSKISLVLTCRFPKPGVYQILLVTELKESNIAFWARMAEVNVISP